MCLERIARWWDRAELSRSSAVAATLLSPKLIGNMSVSNSMRTIIEGLSRNAPVSRLTTAMRGWLDGGGVKEMLRVLPIRQTS